MLKEVTPPGWNIMEARSDGCAYWNPSRRMSVIRSTENWGGKNWIHVSLAARKIKIQMDDVFDIKKLFIGENEYAFMVYPPNDKHVNIHGNCFHLFHCLDGHPFPEFSGLVSGIRTI